MTRLSLDDTSFFTPERPEDASDEARSAAV